MIDTRFLTSLGHSRPRASARRLATSVLLLLASPVSAADLTPNRAQDAPVVAPAVVVPSRPSIGVEAVRDVTAQPAIQIGGAWQAQGPGLSLNGQAENVPGSNPVCGAVQMLAAHPSDANILFAGSVDGGIWRTNDATAAAPTWVPLTDQFVSPSIGDIEFDPTDAGNQTLVAGIGSFSSFGVGGQLVGILRTTNGGNNWTSLGQTDLAGVNVRAVVPRGSTILVGGDAGLFRSTDTGASFPSVSGTNGFPLGAVEDLARDPSNNSRIYAAVSGASGGVFRSDDTGAHWTNVTDAAIDAVVGSSTGNMKISVSAADSNAVYVGIVNTGRLAGVFRSSNQGFSWGQMDLPRTQEGALTIGAHPGGQGGIHFSLVADPTNRNIVYIGGDRQPSNPGADGIEGNNDDTWPNSIGARNYTGRLFRGDAGVVATGAVPSPQWTPLTHSGTGANSSPHADSRDMDFDANGNIVEADDGGVYRRTNPRATNADWTSVIGSIQVSQFHDIAYDANSNLLLGGTQDTGCPLQSAAGSTTWNELTQADGGDVAVDNGVAGQATYYWSSQFLGGFRRRTCTAPGTCGATTNIGLNVTSGAPLGTQFVTPIELNSQNPTRLIIGGNNSVYESADQGDNIAELNSPGVTSNGMVYGHPGNADLILIGSGSQVFRRTTAAGNLTATTAGPGIGGITDIAVDPADANAIFVCSQNRVARTTDGGAHWTNITGNLASMSGDNIETITYVPGTTNDVLVVGAAQGVFALTEPFCGCWFELGTGLPNTFVWELAYDAGDELLVAGSLGRGAWTLSGVASIVGPADASPVVTVQATGGDVDTSCAFLAPYSAVITDDCGVDPSTIVSSASSLDGRSMVGSPSKVVSVVSDTEVRVSGNVLVSAVTGCPARVRIVVEAKDRCGHATTGSRDIEVLDRTPPRIAVTLDRTVLWPPNHKFATIRASVNVFENCPGATFVLKSITSNEPVNALGDGNTSPDITDASYGTPDTVFQLRSERSGKGNGRVYTVVYETSDPCGNKGQATATVKVPHDHSAPALVSSGFLADGKAIAPDARQVAVVVPSYVFEGDELVVTRDGVLTPGETEWLQPMPEVLDATTADAASACIGNLAGIVHPSSSYTFDANQDGMPDLVLLYGAGPVRSLLAAADLESGPVGIHFSTKDGNDFLAPDILALGSPVALPPSLGASGERDLRPDQGAPPVAEQVDPSVPTVTRLAGVLPNPFQSSTVIALDLSSERFVQVSVFNLQGALVRSLIAGRHPAGRLQFAWDGRDEDGRRLAPGVYFVRVVAGELNTMAKAVLLQ